MYEDGTVLVHFPYTMPIVIEVTYLGGANHDGVQERQVKLCDPETSGPGTKASG